jgi:hypothetical protein
MSTIYFDYMLSNSASIMPGIFLKMAESVLLCSLTTRCAKRFWCAKPCLRRFVALRSGRCSTTGVATWSPQVTTPVIIRENRPPRRRIEQRWRRHDSLPWPVPKSSRRIEVLCFSSRFAVAPAHWPRERKRRTSPSDADARCDGSPRDYING